MSYDFFVFPAGLADDLDEALVVYESSRDRGPLTPDGPMARFLAAVDADGLRAEARGHDAAAHV